MTENKRKYKLLFDELGTPRTYYVDEFDYQDDHITFYIPEFKRRITCFTKNLIRIENCEPRQDEDNCLLNNSDE